MSLIVLVLYKLGQHAGNDTKVAVKQLTVANEVYRNNCRQIFVRWVYQCIFS